MADCQAKGPELPGSQYVCNFANYITANSIEILYFILKIFYIFITCNIVLHIPFPLTRNDDDDDDNNDDSDDEF